MVAAGPESVNVSLLNRADLLGEIQRKMDEAVAQSATRGVPVAMELYFPPGWWEIDRDGVFVLPTWVTVRFAPGAMLAVVGRGSVLEINGELLAPIGPIFRIPLTYPVPGRSVGWVSLLGEKILRVHPEWWGAGQPSSTPEVDTQAIEYAVFAATARFRVGADPTEMPLPALPIELLGRYKIARTIELPTRLDRIAPPPPPPVPLAMPAVSSSQSSSWAWSFWDIIPIVAFAHGIYEIARRGYATAGSTTAQPLVGVPVGIVYPDTPPDTIELRGRLDDRVLSTFTAASSFVGSGPMFRVVRRAGPSFPPVVMHAVSFDGAFMASECVRLDGTERPITGRADHFRHCIFRRARDQQVCVQALDPSGGAALMARSTTGVLFEACSFFPESSSLSYCVGAKLLGPDAKRVEFRGCVFVGSASAMISASTVPVVTSNCRFENSRLPWGVASGLLRGTALNQLHQRTAEGGVDVFLSAIEAPVMAGVQRPYNHFELASLDAQDCRSTSVQFLASANLQSVAPSADTTVVGLSHEFSAATLSPDQIPPVLLWRGARSAGAGASVVVIGARFDNASPMSPPRIVAEGGSTFRPALLDLGMVGPNAVSTPGLGSAFYDSTVVSTVGVVPVR